VTVKLENNWQFKSLVSLQKLTNFSVSENPPSRLVRRCEELHLIPLNEYSIEDLRLMIGQEFALEYLIPLAIEKLHEDVLAEGDYYPGDLLSSVLKINPSFWKQNPDLYKQLKGLVGKRREDIKEEGISLKLFESDL